MGMNTNDEGSSVYELTGTRLSPRGNWYSKRWDFIVAALFFFGSITLFLVEYNHPVAAPVAAIAFLAYGFLDYFFAHRLFRSSTGWDQWFWRSWNWIGLLGSLFVYFWIVRDSGTIGPALLWPLLVYPFYFLLRLTHPPHFLPWMILPIGLLPIFAFLVSDRFASSDQRLYNLAGAGWLLVTLIIITVHLRAWDFHKNRFDAYRSLMKWAGSPSAKLSDVGNYLHDLGVRLNLERLTILEIFRPSQDADFRQIENEHLSISNDVDKQAVRPPLYVKIIAKFLSGYDNTEIRPWPLTRGLLKHAYETRKAVNCPDTASRQWKEIFYTPEDGFTYQDTRCEFVMPIWDSPDGEIIGFVDLQSREPDGLPTEDLDYLSALSVAVAPLMTKARLEKLMTGLEKVRLSLEKMQEEQDIFNQVATFAQEYLDVDVVIYYKLGFGTGWPLLPPLQTGAWFPARLRDQDSHRKDAPPIYLVSKWSPLFEPDAKTNAQLFPREWQTVREMEHFISREKIESTVFLPIGTPSRRVGALLLNFRRQQTFSPTTCLVLEILRQIITPHVETARRIDEAYRGFGQTAFILHDLLRESLGASLFFAPYIAQLRKALHSENKIEFEAVLDEFGNTLGVHTKAIKSAYLKSALNHHKKLEQGLAPAFRLAAGWLEEQYSGRTFRWEFTPPSLDTTLTYDLRMAINSIVVETVHNAVRHGRANLVKVKIRRDDSGISISILSDGIPWDPANPATPFSKFGISARLSLASDRMMANHHWNMEGRQLTINIPILPVLDGKDPYGNETSSNRGR